MFSYCCIPNISFFVSANFFISVNKIDPFRITLQR